MKTHAQPSFINQGRGRFNVATLRQPKFMVGIGVVVLLSLSPLVAFQVDSTQYAIVSQFGSPVRAIKEPGLYAKLPDPFQNLIRLDKRVQVHNITQTEFLTKDKKNILVEAYATWRVDDPVQFFKSVRDAQGASARLSDILTSELGVALSQYELANLVSTNPEQIQLPQMLEHLSKQTDEKTRPYG